MKSTTRCLALVGTLFLVTGCEKQALDDTICNMFPEMVATCAITSWIQDKPAAQASLLGDWQWLQTSYPTRGVPPENTRLETPRSTGKTRIYRFTADRCLILENGQTIQDLPYEIRFRGEGPNTVDPDLTLRVQSSATSFFVSLLHLDQGQECMQLVNSYNDAGGDINLKRMEKNK